jgi:hypothetical protein
MPHCTHIQDVRRDKAGTVQIIGGSMKSTRDGVCASCYAMWQRLSADLPTGTIRLRKKGQRQCTTATQQRTH